MAATFPVFVPDALRAQEAIADQLRRLFPSGCTRILLVHPVTVAKEDFEVEAARRSSYSATLPYGLALLSRQLQNAGYEVSLLDLNYEILCRAQDDPHFTYDVWRVVLASYIAEFRPHLTAVSNMFSTGYHSVRETIIESKNVAPHIPVIAGGVHPSGYPKLYLEQTPTLDLVMIYEADSSFPKFVDVVNGRRPPSDLSQMATLIDGQYVEIAKRDSPEPVSFDVMPDYHDLPIGDYSRVGMIGAYRWYPRSQPMRAATLHSRRGCRAHCTFCSVEGFNGRGVRRREYRNVVDERDWLFERYGINHVMWIDDDLFADPKDAIELFNEMARRKLDITWEASNGVIASATNPEILAAAAGSGCIGLHFGVESGSEAILRSVKKPSGVKHFRRLREFLKPYPQIFSRGMLILGFPGETISQINETVNLGLEMQLDWYPIQILNFLGNTAMARELIRSGQLQEQSIVDAAFFVGAFGEQQQRERNEEATAKLFPANILQWDGSYVPAKEELPDIWFLMDWLLNWRPLLKETDEVKLRLKLPFLRDICTRKTLHNPLATMFLGIVETKLGLFKEARQHFDEARIYMDQSAFWRVRAEALNLSSILESWAYGI